MTDNDYELFDKLQFYYITGLKKKQLTEMIKKGELNTKKIGSIIYVIGDEKAAPYLERYRKWEHKEKHRVYIMGGVEYTGIIAHELSSRRLGGRRPKRGNKFLEEV